jgi:hypothetical protein
MSETKKIETQKFGSIYCYIAEDKKYMTISIMDWVEGRLVLKQAITTDHFKVETKTKKGFKLLQQND